MTVSEIETAYLLGNAGLNQFIVAISVGSVFFGANTYIGNGPNFMVKAIADQQKAHTPTFLGSDILIPRLSTAEQWKKGGPDFWILAVEGQFL